MNKQPSILSTTCPQLRHLCHFLFLESFKSIISSLSLSSTLSFWNSSHEIPECHGALQWEHNNLEQCGHLDFVTAIPSSTRTGAEHSLKGQYNMAGPWIADMQRSLPHISNNSGGRIMLQNSIPIAPSQFKSGHLTVVMLSSIFALMWARMQSKQKVWEQPCTTKFSYGYLGSMQIVQFWAGKGWFTCEDWPVSVMEFLSIGFTGSVSWEWWKASCSCWPIPSWWIERLNELSIPSWWIERLNEIPHFLFCLLNYCCTFENAHV